jgi:hypothetical protein
MKNKKKSPQNAQVVSYINLRIGLGVLGFFLPFFLIVGNWLFSGCTQLQPSISHYYYTYMGDFFVGALSAVAMFLFFYKGYDKRDAIVANCTAVFALATAFFPTSPYEKAECTYFIISDPRNFNAIHYSAAALLFLSFAYISIVLFTKSKPGKIITPVKKIRNKIYKTCGIIILFCVALIACYNFLDKINIVWYETISTLKPTLFLETAALMAFGFSWITKGKMFLSDEEDE